MNTSKKILIVDDDEGVLDALTMILQYKGYEVNTAKNANLLAGIKDEMPDLLLLDIWMSGIDGRDVCKQLKRQEGTKYIPVIMISASKDIGPSALASGADDFLAKPFEMNELVEKIEFYTARVS